MNLIFTVYILYSEAFDKYYIGQTNNFNRRLIEHNSGKSKFTKAYTPWKVILKIEKSSRSEAIKLESKIKNLSRERMARFIQKYG